MKKNNKRKRLIKKVKRATDFAIKKYKEVFEELRDK